MKVIKQEVEDVFYCDLGRFEKTLISYYNDGTFKREIIKPKIKPPMKNKELVFKEFKKNKKLFDSVFPTKAKMKSKSGILKTIKTQKGRWEIYSYISKGVTLYGNRLMANNGNNICNNKDFNSPQGALKNIRAVQKTAV